MQDLIFRLRRIFEPKHESPLKIRRDRIFSTGLAFPTILIDRDRSTTWKDFILLLPFNPISFQLFHQYQFHSDLQN